MYNINTVLLRKFIPKNRPITDKICLVRSFRNYGWGPARYEVLKPDGNVVWLDASRVVGLNVRIAQVVKQVNELQEELNQLIMCKEEAEERFPISKEK